MEGGEEGVVGQNVEVGVGEEGDGKAEFGGGIGALAESPVAEGFVV